jgi:hypothetical protein
MTMPHKTCSRCGQPAVLTMAQCQRCGFAYASTLSSPPVRPPGSAATEIPAAQRQMQQRRRHAGPTVLLIAVGLGVLLLGAGLNVLRQAALRHAEFPSRGLPGGSPLNGAPAESAVPPGKLSLFVESNSAEEMPTLTFRNLADGVMTLTLRDRYGHVYRAASRQSELATLQVPAGDYSVSLESDVPRIRPNWGDATFRRYKSYNALFVAGHSDARVHLGE